MLSACQESQNVRDAFLAGPLPNCSATLHSSFPFITFVNSFKAQMIWSHSPCERCARREVHLVPRRVSDLKREQSVRCSPLVRHSTRTTPPTMISDSLLLSLLMRQGLCGVYTLHRKVSHHTTQPLSPQRLLQPLSGVRSAITCCCRLLAAVRSIFPTYVRYSRNGRRNFFLCGGMYFPRMRPDIPSIHAVSRDSCLTHCGTRQKTQTSREREITSREAPLPDLPTCAHSSITIK